MSDQTMQPQLNRQSQPEPAGAAPSRSLRLWPGIVLVAVLWLVRAWASTGEPSYAKLIAGRLIVPLAVLAGVVLWWLFGQSFALVRSLAGRGDLRGSDAGHDGPGRREFSRTGAADLRSAHPWSARGWDGWCFPSCCLGRSAGRAYCWFSSPWEWAAACCAATAWMEVSSAKFHWRWTPTPEQQFLAELKSKPATVRRATRRAAQRTAGRLARLPRAAARRPIAGRADQDRLAAIAAAGIVAASHRSRLVVVRRDWRPALHAGTAGRRRVCRLLRRDERGGSVGPPRCGAVLRGWSAAPVRARHPRFTPGGCTRSGPTVI